MSSSRPKRSASGSASSVASAAAASASSSSAAASPIAHLFTPLKSLRSSSTRSATAAAAPSRDHIDLAYEEPASAAAAIKSKPKVGGKQARSSSPIDLAEDEDENEGSSDDAIDLPVAKKARSSSSSSSKRSPEHWEEVWDLIKEMRTSGPARDAPVDTLGCERLADRSADGPTFRFQTLVALMLSAQTKDAVTATALGNLRSHFASSGGLTVANVAKADEAVLDKLICKVGFHQRKANFIRRTAELCLSDHGGDIPRDLSGLVALPGVGPKMAHLTMQCAWASVVGVGVDTHVHRISNRLGWVKSQTPEQTRAQLEQWLPKDKWGPINALLVGFGQMQCQPVRPKCENCTAKDLCPEGRKNTWRFNKKPKLLKSTSLVSAPALEQPAAAASSSASALLARSKSLPDWIEMKAEPLPSVAASSSSSALPAASAIAATAAPAALVTSRFFPLPLKNEPFDPEPYAAAGASTAAAATATPSSVAPSLAHHTPPAEVTIKIEPHVKTEGEQKTDAPASPRVKLEKP